MKRFLMVLFVIAVIGGSWLIYSRGQGPVEAQQSLPEGVRTAPVERGDIEAVVSATGSVVAEETESLSFASAGEVVEVLVEEGQRVEKGQVLARLDSENLELNLRQAQAALAVSEAQLARARTQPTEEEIASARAAVASAKANLQDLKDGSTWREQELARLAIDQAKNSLWGAQGNRDAISGSPAASGGQKAQAEAQVLNAEIQVKIAELQYQQLFEDPKVSALAQAETQIAQAEANLAKLLEMPSEEDIAVAEAQVQQARVNVDVAQKALDDANYILVAPVGGELVEWNLDVGDTVSPGAPVGTLVDNGRYHIRVRIDETEIGEIEVGQDVRIVLDAFPDRDLVGHVTEVDLAGENLQGIVAYGVRIDIDPTDLPIRPLMTAAIDIITQRVEDALLVPNRALRRDQDGIYVEVANGGTREKVYVETGVDSDQYTELVSGLDEGQEVVVSAPRENLFDGPFGG